MKNRKHTESSNTRGRWRIPLDILVLLAGALCAWCLAHQADQGMRSTALPAGLVLLIMIGIAAAMIGPGRAQASLKPVLRRLLPALTLMLLLLFALAGALLWHQHQDRLNGRTALVANEVNRDLHKALKEQARGLAAALQPIVADKRTREGLRSGDRKKLLADWKPLFETLHREQNLTHFYFSDAGRNCLARLHKPEKFGDRFDRFTILEAERTGKVASGIELGPLGTFTLRVVAPVFDGATRIGYVELGKEIEDVLRSSQGERTGVELAVILRKDELTRETWEAGMKMLGREADWNRLPRSVVIYASQGRLPDAFAALADQDLAGGHEHNKFDREIVDAGKIWCFTAFGLADASGKEVGELLVMNNITALKADFNRTIFLGGTAGGILLALLLGTVFVLLRRTDAGIREQQKALRESEEHLSATLRSIGDGVIACDGEGRVTSLNGAAEALTGWSAAEAAGRPLEEVFRIIHAQTREPAENPVRRALAEGVNVDLANHTALIARDGTERQIADSCAPIRDASGTVAGAVLAFRDVTEEYALKVALRERVKELTCLEAVRQAVHGDASVEDACRSVIPHIIQGMQFPEITVAVISAGSLVVACEGWVEGLTHGMHADIRVYGEVWGRISIFYTQAKPFLTEEQRLVVAIATILSHFCERKEAEHRLTKSEDRFDRAITGTGAGLWDWDMVKDTVFFSPHWKSMLGYEDHEVENDFSGWKNLWHPEDAARIEKAVNDHIEGRTTVYEVEHRLRHKDGSWRWILTRGDIQKDAAGKPVCWTGTNIDITERKRAEEAALQEQRRAETLLSLSQISNRPEEEVIATAVEAAISLTGSNIGYFATLDESESVLTMRYWSKSAHAQCQVTDKPIIYPVAHTGLWGEAVRQRKPIITNDYAAPNPLKRGTPEGHVPVVRHMNIPVFFDNRMVGVAGVGNKQSDYNDGDVRQLQIFMNGLCGILHRKRAEAKLAENEMRYRSIFELANDGIFLQDETGFIDSNQRGSDMYGLPRERIVGRHPGEFAPERRPGGRLSAEVAAEKIAAVMAGIPQTFEWRPLRADGTPFDVEITLSRIDFGPKACIQSIVRDITDRKRAEQEIHQARDQYQSLVENIPGLTYRCKCDKDWTMLFMSDAVDPLTGYPPNDLSVANSG
jgi:PAS domain S-box-containing protein